ncbi:DUF502 domain-containing protein [Alteromonas halophila]|uniref:Membrane protein n=1 Tax=Alteromonas halophila TaxID=516698 RepID=A0A918JPB4_9ALTE|nr:DUF502 domain-containing protein [Alteromonas halophila]GGW90988.1 membrane protein [Alteromonas halophila]
MSQLVSKMVKGLLTILPIVVTLYLLIWLGLSTEALVKPLLAPYYYFPGLGIITTIMLLAVTGIAVNAYLVDALLKKLQFYIERLPLIKTVYGALNDAAELFKASKEQQQQRAVLAEVMPDTFVVGFITGENATSLLFPEGKKVAVYIPMSYQIGGYTLYLGEEKLQRLDIDVETAMRIAVTGGNSINKQR